MSDKTWVEKWKEAENDPYKTPFPMAKEMAHKLDEYEAKEKDKEDPEEELDRKVKAANEKIRREAKVKEYRIFSKELLERMKKFYPEPITRLDYFAARAPDPGTSYTMKERAQSAWLYAKDMMASRPKDD